MTILGISSPSLTSCRAKIRKKKTLKWDENNYLCICRAYFFKHWPYYKSASTIVIVYRRQRGNIHFKNVFTLFYFVYRPQSRTLPPKKISFKCYPKLLTVQEHSCKQHNIFFSLITFTCSGHINGLLSPISNIHSYCALFLRQHGGPSKPFLSPVAGGWVCCQCQQQHWHISSLQNSLVKRQHVTH